MRQLCGPVAILGFLLGCSADPGPTVIFPSQSANAVSNALIDVRLGGVLADKVRGDLPAPTNSANAPRVSSEVTELSANTNSRVLLEVKVDSEGPLQALYAKVLGAAEFYQVQLSATKVQGVFGVGFGIPSNFADGRFCVQTGVRDQFGQVGQNPEAICISVNSDLDAVPPPTQSPTNPPAPTTPPQPTAPPTAAPTSGPTQPPAATPTPPPAAGLSARDCFNPAVLQQGTRYELTYSGDNQNGQGQVDFTQDCTVNGTVTFRGQSTIETECMVTSTVSGAGPGSGSSQSESRGYSQGLAGGFGSQTVGGIVESQSSTQFGTVTTRSEFVYEPPLLSRYDLEVGQSYSNDTTQTTETTVNFAGTSETNTSTQSFQSTTTYIGRALISVPAGSFDTCRMDTESSSTDANGQSTTGSSTNYFAVGTGVLVRNESGDSVTELQGGSINGQALR